MKKYIKPSIEVEEVELIAVMEGASVTGTIKPGDKVVVSAKGSWDNDDESEDTEY